MANDATDVPNGKELTPEETAAGYVNAVLWLSQVFRLRPSERLVMSHTGTIAVETPAGTAAARVNQLEGIVQRFAGHIRDAFESYGMRSLRQQNEALRAKLAKQS